MTAAGDGAGPIVVLATDGPSTRIVYHWLAAHFPGVRVVLEEPVSRAHLVRRRLAKLGPLRVMGQLLFMAAVLPAVRRRAAGRIRRIMEEHALDDSEIPPPVIRVGTVNSEEAREVLRGIGPAVVVVNGTRIIGRQTLGCVPAPFINTHAGITPLYRGVHGGYWALAEGRSELVGSTVHLVDEGIDTGGVLEQVTFETTSEDSFATYPYLHTAAALPALLRAVRGALAGTLEPKRPRPELESRLRYHPTAAEYLRALITRGVR